MVLLKANGGNSSFCKTTEKNFKHQKHHIYRSIPRIQLRHSFFQYPQIEKIGRTKKRKSQHFSLTVQLVQKVHFLQQQKRTLENSSIYFSPLIAKYDSAICSILLKFYFKGKNFPDALNTATRFFLYIIIRIFDIWQRDDLFNTSAKLNDCNTAKLHIMKRSCKTHLKSFTILKPR